jgi:hypothetical protein
MSPIARRHKPDIRQFRAAAREAGLIDPERFAYSEAFHAGHRWEEDGNPDYSWLVDDMRQWKKEHSRGRHP